MKKNKYRVLSTKYSAFTLIELLVVFAIIGILFATVAANFNTSKSRARDALRESDIKQYQTQLEVFANTQSSQLYPSRITTAVDITSLCTTLGISATCPTDPRCAWESNGCALRRFRPDAGGGSDPDHDSDPRRN